MLHDKIPPQKFEVPGIDEARLIITSEKPDDDELLRATSFMHLYPELLFESAVIEALQRYLGVSKGTQYLLLVGSFAVKGLIEGVASSTNRSIETVIEVFKAQNELPRRLPLDHRSLKEAVLAAEA